MRNQLCMQCGYYRKAEDTTAPDWVCPRCNTPYPRATRLPQKSAPKKPYNNTHHPLRIIQNPILFRLAQLLEFLLIITLIMLTASYFLKGRLPNSELLSPALSQPPIQSPTSEAPFSFSYRKQTINVIPVADYELWGLIVSHNDINSFIWGYDENDVNIKDVCILWGNNLANNVFHHFTIWNSQWTCHIEYTAPYATKFDPTALSNNHLLSDKPTVQNTIRGLHIGDQVHVKGMLVNYNTAKMGDGWRKSSTRRDDVGDGACEVFFVDSIDVLKHNTPGWFIAYALLKWILLFLILARILVTAIDIFVFQR